MGNNNHHFMEPRTTHWKRVRSAEKTCRRSVAAVKRFGQQDRSVRALIMRNFSIGWPRVPFDWRCNWLGGGAVVMCTRGRQTMRFTGEQHPHLNDAPDAM